MKKIKKKDIYISFFLPLSQLSSSIPSFILLLLLVFPHQFFLHFILLISQSGSLEGLLGIRQILRFDIRQKEKKKGVLVIHANKPNNSQDIFNILHDFGSYFHLKIN